MSRIESTFTRLRSSGTTGLVTFVTAGDPDHINSGRILRALDDAGADIIEVGVPFSDPLADGPVIQRACERALAAGATLSSALALIAEVRSGVRAPIVVFSYVNPILHLGITEFARCATEAGVDGVLVLDLPVEEASELREALASVKIDMIFLVSPTTSDYRLQIAATLGRGFLYGISRLGVTGARQELSSGARELAERVRAITAMPLAMGFGIASPEHVVEVGSFADAAVVGSGLVNVVAELAGSPSLPDKVRDYVSWLKSGTLKK